MMEEGRTPKIVDVARLAGVSTATVSRTLSKPETVAQKTRDAVLKAAKESGYRVNLSARSLRSRRTGVVGVLVPNLGNTFFSRILAGIESTLARKGLSVLMVDTMHQTTKPEFILDYLNDSRVDGILSLDGSLSPTLLQAGQATAGLLPTVFVCEWHDQGNHPSIRVDNLQGSALAIDHLVALGHTKIGLINGPLDNVLSKARLSGALAAIKKANLKIDDSWQFESDFSLQSGVAAADSLLTLRDRPTALFCANDETAIGLISQLHRRGFYVPKDFSVVGFDDIDIARHYLPALTTIWQPRMELGEIGAQMLIERLENKASHTPQPAKVLPVELIIRETTARPT